jgi:hypothetical protein
MFANLPYQATTSFAQGISSLAKSTRNLAASSPVNPKKFLARFSSFSNWIMLGVGDLLSPTNFL